MEEGVVIKRELLAVANPEFLRRGVRPNVVGGQEGDESYIMFFKITLQKKIAKSYIDGSVPGF